MLHTSGVPQYSFVIAIFIVEKRGWKWNSGRPSYRNEIKPVVNFNSTWHDQCTSASDITFLFVLV